MVLADHVYRDADTGKFLIVGTFGAIFIRQNIPVAPPVTPQTGPSEIEGDAQSFASSSVSAAGTPYLYIALTGVHGKTPLRLRYVHLADSSVSLEGEIEVESSDPLALAEFSLPLPSLLRGPGLYSLDLLHDGEILGSWRVTIGFPPPQPPVEEQQ